MRRITLNLAAIALLAWTSGACWGQYPGRPETRDPFNPYAPGGYSQPGQYTPGSQNRNRFSPYPPGLHSPHQQAPASPGARHRQPGLPGDRERDEREWWQDPNHLRHVPVGHGGGGHEGIKVKPEGRSFTSTPAPEVKLPRSSAASSAASEAGHAATSAPKGRGLLTAIGTGIVGLFGAVLRALFGKRDTQ